MQKRSRRPHGIGAEKISVSVTREDLAVLRRRAKLAHGGNVSAVLHDMVATLRREEAMDRLLAKFGGDRVTDAQLQSLREEIAAAALPRARRGTAA